MGKKLHLSQNGKQLLERFRNSLLKDESFITAIDTLDKGDLQAIKGDVGNVLSRWLRLVEHRRRTIKGYKSVEAIPAGVQRYHTLMLHETAQETFACINRLRGLLVRLELTGLNESLSKFCIDHILVKGAKQHGTHFLETEIIRENMEVIREMLTEQGLSEPEIGIFDEMLETMPETIDVSVMVPDHHRPATGPPVVVVIPGAPSISLPKGFDNWFENFFEDLEDYLKNAIDMEWTYGMGGAYGNMFISLDFSHSLGFDDIVIALAVALGALLLKEIDEDLADAFMNAAVLIMIKNGTTGAKGIGDSFMDP